MTFQKTLLFLGLLPSAFAVAGPFAPAAGQPGSTAIAATSPAIAAWATGFEQYLPGPNVSAPFDTPSNALGAASGNPVDVVSLGDAGRITLTFSGTIFNGPGADFAVFENSFSDTFLELAFVEVSSNGVDFFRFPGFSFTANPIGAFGTLDPTDIDGLAGKYRGGFGTPFDLDLLKSVPGLNVAAVTHVRIVDIPGDGSVLDALGRPIYDPTGTTGSGGFDLDGVGVLHFAAAPPIPEPGTLWMFAAGGALPLVRAARRSRRTA